MPRVSAAMQATLLLLLLLVLTTLSTLLKTPDKFTEAIANRSIYNSGPSGIRAWYLAAQKARLPMTSWEKPFADLDDVAGPATMLIVQPFTMAPVRMTQGQIAYGEQESEKLLRWVAQGNTLVLLDDFKRKGSKSLINHLKIPVKTTRSSTPLSLQNAAFGQFVEGNLQSHQAHAYFRLQPENKETTVLLQNQQKQPILIRLPYQKGVLILGTTPDLIENQWLHRNADNNFQFLTNLLVLEKKPILINEFVHGYNRVENLFAFLREKTLVGAILMQLIFAFLLVLWLGFTRWVPVSPTLENTTKHSGLRSFIDALAHLYYRRQAVSLAIQPHIQKITEILHQRYQIELIESAENAPLQNLLEALPRPYSSKEAKSVLAALQEAKKLAEPDALNFAKLPHRELYRLSMELTKLQERLQHAKR